MTDIEYEEYKIIKNFKETHEHICSYCGKVIIDSKDLTADHIIPRWRGGLTEEKNLCIACYSCNHDKDRTKPFQYINCKIKTQQIKERQTKRSCQKIARNLNMGLDNVEYLARHDSNIWDLKTFFNKNSSKIANEIGC